MHSVHYIPRWVALCSLGLVNAQASHAAAVIPGSADPARIEERFSNLPTPDVEASQETGSALPAVQAPPGAEAVRFILQEVTVDGVTVYSPERIAAFYASHLKQEISVQTLYEIAANITQLYRNDGYAITRAMVPEQEIKNGRVRIHVAEGYVGSVSLQGSVGSNRIIEDFIHKITSMRPLHTPTLERLLLSLNDFAGINAKATLQPAQSAEQGEITLLLTVERKPIGGNISFDNYGSRFIGPYEGTANVWAGNQLLPFDRLGLRVLGTPQTDEMRYGELSYKLPVNAYGTTVGLSASKAHSEPGYRLKQFEITSDSTNVGIDLSHSFIHTRDRLLTTRAALERKSVDTDLIATKLYSDRLTVASLGGSFNLADRWNGINTADLYLRKGLNALGARKTGSPDLSRVEGHSDFTTLNTTFSRLQALPGRWQLYASMSGQIASSPLLASEEFGVGGQRYGRAYDPSEIIGDEGIAGSLELRYNSWQISDNAAVMPFCFYDIGKVWNLDTGGIDESLASAGCGITLRSAGAQLSVSVAQPLTRPQSAPLYGDAKAPRTLFYASWSF